MVQRKDLSVVERFKKALSKKFAITSIILFGSRVKGLFREDSDFDMIIVSKDFEGIPQHKRAQSAYMEWTDERPAEILCYTPEEMKKRSENPFGGIVSEALKQGVSV